MRDKKDIKRSSKWGRILQELKTRVPQHREDQRTCNGWTCTSCHVPEVRQAMLETYSQSQCTHLPSNLMWQRSESEQACRSQELRVSAHTIEVPQSFLWPSAQDVPYAAGWTMTEALSRESLDVMSQVNSLPQGGWRPKYRHMRSSWRNKPRMRLPSESWSQLGWALADLPTYHLGSRQDLALPASTSCRMSPSPIPGANTGFTTPSPYQVLSRSLSASRARSVKSSMNDGMVRLSPRLEVGVGEGSAWIWFILLCSNWTLWTAICSCSLAPLHPSFPVACCDIVVYRCTINQTAHLDTSSSFHNGAWFFHITSMCLVLDLSGKHVLRWPEGGLK